MSPSRKIRDRIRLPGAEDRALGERSNELRPTDRILDARERLEAIGPRNAMIKELRARAEAGDARAKELLEYIESSGERSAPRTSDLIRDREPLRALDLYRTGLDAMRIRSWRGLREMARDPLTSEATLRMLGGLAGSGLHPVEQIMLVGQKLEAMREINDLIGGAIPGSLIESNAVSAEYIPQILSLTRAYSHDSNVMANVENAISEIAMSEPERASAKLIDVLNSARSTSLSEEIRLEIAARVLSSGGKEGVSAVLDAYSSSNDPSVRTTLHKALLSASMDRETLGSSPILAKLIQVALKDPSGVQLGISILRGIGLSGRMSEAGELTKVAQLIASSEAENVQGIQKRARAYSDALKNEDKIGTERSEGLLALTIMVKAVLTEHGIDLLVSGDHERARDALSRALEIGDFGTMVPGIRYALAVNYFGLKDFELSRDNLKKAVELDSRDLSEMMMNLNMVSQIGDERLFIDLGRHMESINEITKATALYALGYIVNNKYAEPEKARIFLKMLMANPVVWNALEGMLSKDPKAFISMLDRIVSKVREEKERKVVSNIPLLAKSFSTSVGDAIGEVMWEMEVDGPLPWALAA